MSFCVAGAGSHEPIVVVVRHSIRKIIALMLETLHLDEGRRLVHTEGGGVIDSKLDVVRKETEGCDCL